VDSDHSSRTRPDDGDAPIPAVRWRVAVSSRRAWRGIRVWPSSTVARCYHCPRTASRSTTCWARRTIAHCARRRRRRRSSSGHIGFRRQVPVRKPFLGRLCRLVPLAAAPSVIGAPSTARGRARQPRRRGIELRKDARRAGPRLRRPLFRSLSVLGYQLVTHGGLMVTARAQNFPRAKRRRSSGSVSKSASMKISTVS
jgi:hypothetical protein